MLLVRPAAFAANPETAPSNVFQSEVAGEDITERARQEFDLLADVLTANGVNAHIFDDTPTPAKPDAVFPNNWVSLHHDGTVVIYPLMAASRRPERREDIIDDLRKKFRIEQVLDLTHYENGGRYLEGTGSVVFDHRGRVAYASLSPRTHEIVLRKLCDGLEYTPMTFRSYASGHEIYHTNVMMSVGSRFAIACIEAIEDASQRRRVSASLAADRELIEITPQQMKNFAGNVLLLKGSDGELLMLSERARRSLSSGQLAALERHCRLVSVDIPTIETCGGGGVRCMIAEVFLPPLGSE